MYRLFVALGMWSILFVFSWCTISDMFWTSKKKLYDQFVQAQELHSQQAYTWSNALLSWMIDSWYMSKQVHMLYGVNKYMMQQYTWSIAELKRVLVMDDAFTWAYMYLWDAYSTVYRWEEAIDMYTTYMSYEPTDYTVATSLWYALYHQGRFDDARTWFDVVLKKDPKNARALSMKGTLVADTGNLSGALVYFDRAIEEDPTSAIHYFNKWSVLSDIGYLAAQDDKEQRHRSRQAIDMFNKALDYNPWRYDALLYKWLTEYDLWLYTWASETFHEALGIDGWVQDYSSVEAWFVDVLYHLSQVSVALEEYATAEHILYHILVLDPSYTRAERALETIRENTDESQT